jgi:hypothetical protein
VLARFAGVDVAPADDYASLGPRDLFIIRARSSAPPCARLPNGDGVYFERGRDLQPLAGATNLYCPARTPAAYRGGPPAPADPGVERRLNAELRAAGAQGARRVYFAEGAATSPYLGGLPELRRLSNAAALAAPPAGLAAGIGRDGVTVFTALHNRTTPKPCFRLPDGSGLFLVRGQLTQSLDYATNLYCPTRSSATYRAPLAG